MNVSLGEIWERFVREKVDLGEHQSRGAPRLLLLCERDEERAAKLEALRMDIEIGRRDAREGRIQPFDDATAEQIKAEGRRRAGLSE